MNPTPKGRGFRAANLVKPRMTNGDRIRQVSNDKLVEVILSHGRCVSCPRKWNCVWKNVGMCRDLSLKWLNEEVGKEEDES